MTRLSFTEQYGLKRAPFISFEGIDGSGKSTVLGALKQWLEQCGCEVYSTREPGGTLGGENLRTLLFQYPWKPKAEALLMFAQRVQHIEELIQPLLQKGVWVLSDRFVDSTYAYQAEGRGLGVDQITQLDHWSLKGFYPDLTFLLDLPAEQALLRRKNRQMSLAEQDDRFEVELASRFSDLREAFLSRARSDINRIIVLDASQPLSCINQQIQDIIQKKFSSLFTQEGKI